MKAAVCYEFGKPLVVEDVEIGQPQAGEVRVRMTAVAICHSDIHLIKGEWGGELPMIAGHEAAGVITEVGDGVYAVQPGDHVVLSLLRSCGRCFYCTTGAPYNCAAEYRLDEDSALRTNDGQPIRYGLNCAAFAEEAIVHHSQVVPVSPGLAPDRAALLACGVITGVGAVTNTARVEPNSSVVVVGAGGVGLNTIQGAAIAGAYPIIAIDIRESKLAHARAFGSTHTLDANGGDDLAKAVRGLTDGRGADYAFVTVGTSEAGRQAFYMLRKEGTLVMVGIPSLSDNFTVPATDFIFGGPRRIVGSAMGSTRLSVDVPRLVAQYERGKLKLDELITGRYPLSQINDAIESVEQGDALRNVVLFD